MRPPKELEDRTAQHQEESRAVPQACQLWPLSRYCRTKPVGNSVWASAW